MEIVELKIKSEIQQQKGAIIYDGSMNTSTLYMGVFAVYMRDVSYVRNSAIFNGQELSSPLLSASPMASPVYAESDSAD